jgi:hypothetical protein
MSCPVRGSIMFKRRVMWPTHAALACLFMTYAPNLLAGQAQPPMLAAPAAQLCHLSIDQDVMDYGSFTAGQLARTNRDEYALDPRNLRISVNCPSKAMMALKLTGPSATNGSGAPKFAARGSVRVTMSDAIMDGETIGMRVPARNDIEQRSLDVLTNDTILFHTKDGNSAGTNLTVRLRIEPTVEDSDTRITDQTLWMAQLRFELVTP